MSEGINSWMLGEEQEPIRHAIAFSLLSLPFDVRGAINRPPLALQQQFDLIRTQDSS